MFPNFETNAIRAQLPRSNEKEHSVPLFLTSSFIFDDAEHARALFAEEVTGNQYSRFSNPNTTELINKLCILEGTEDGVPTASGMAGVFLSMFSLLKAGDHVIVSRSIFGSTHQVLTLIFPRYQISHTYVDIGDEEAWEKAVQPNTKLAFIETPSNPALDIIDLEWFSGFCKKYKIISIVDNCFCTPYIQKPANWGIDIVVHSGTKFMDGQGRVLAGAVLGPKHLIKDIRFMSRHTGPALSPFNAWILSKSLETLAVRMEAHSKNALELASLLQNHSEIELVKYPFLESHPQFKTAKKQMKLGGGVLSFIVKGGLERGRRFLDALTWFSLTANLGDTRTTATHPASTTHAKLKEEERVAVGIQPGLIRISVGLEHIDDIKAEIEGALSKSK